LLSAAPWLVVGFGLAGAIHVLLPVGLVTRHLGKPGLKGVLKATILGIPLPLCSCSVIPVASAIRRQGASRGATGGFLISVPETGVDSMAVSYALLGPFLAVVRPVAALVSAVAAGVAIDWFDRDTEAVKETEPDAGRATVACSHCDDDVRAVESDSAASGAASCCSAEAGANGNGVWGKIFGALHYGFVTMFADLSGWLAIGFALAGLVSALVPADFLTDRLGSGFSAMGLMVVAGLPLYVCATASTPIAAMLIAKGLSVGAALVFLLVGPATNIATMMIVGRELGRRSLMIYLGSIIVVAVLAGLGTDALLESSPILNESVQAHVHGAPPARAWIFGIVLMGLIVNGLRLQVMKGKPEE